MDAPAFSASSSLTVTHPIDFFSRSYQEARERFRAAAAQLNATQWSYPIEADPELTIDVARINGPALAGRADEQAADSDRPLLIISSGVHGTEGPPGSAIQLAVLDAVADDRFPDGVDLLLLHAINPYGYVHRRRWNEDNVDLNRNFLDAADQFSGAPKGYDALHPVLNPASPPNRAEFYRLKAAWSLLRYGRQVIKEAVATGQYDYPQGIFFGGHQSTYSARILRDHYREWIGEASETVHLDMHTGLGKHGDYRLLLEYPEESSQATWFAQRFGSPPVEAQQSNRTSYNARGTFGRWTDRALGERTHRFATVEFGTYSLVRVLGALRAENRAHHYSVNGKSKEWTKSELQECFCPASETWRNTVVEQGLSITERCATALSESLQRG